MGREARFRKDLSMPGMLAEMRRCFERVADPVACRGLKLSECLMSGLAVFSLKYPSLLQFERDARGIGEARDGLRREHPHLPLAVVEDGLASNGPHVRLLKELDMRFVLGAKPGDHKALFAWVDELEATPPAPGAKLGVERWETTDAEGMEHRFRWSNGAPLNDANMDLEVNFLEYWERRPNGREKRFSWVTDLRVDRWNAMDLMRAGRARWRPALRAGSRTKRSTP